MRSHAAAAPAALVLGVCIFGGCGAAPTAPDKTSAPPDAIVIEILGVNGDRSFSPNPIDVPAGRAVVWHNADFETHHIVLDAGDLDTGEIRAGRFSAAMPAAADEGYHCTIHPSMIGTIRRR